MACYEEPVRTGLLLPRTARARIVVLKQLQDFARKHGHMKTKPVDEVLDELKGIKDRKVRAFTVEQVKTLLKATEQRPKNWEQRTSDLRRIIVHLAAVCGLRYGEIAGLAVENIDLDKGVLRIRHSFSKHDGIKGPKTAAGVRDFPPACPDWSDDHGLPARPSPAEPARATSRNARRLAALGLALP
ncbi:tyrosine-type recombinase/integrase [Methylorubrum aminovorans]